MLRSQNLASKLTEKEHKEEWNLFVEEWKIRFIRHLSYGHEYYFGYGLKSNFPDDIKLGHEELLEIAESAARVQTVEFPNVGSTRYSNRFLKETAIAVIYDFTRIYDENDDPIRSAREFQASDLYSPHLSNLHGLWTYLSIRTKFIIDGADVRERKQIEDDSSGG